MKNNVKSVSFWVELSGVIGFFIETICKLLNISNFSYEIQNLILSICAILIVIGVVTKKDSSDSENFDHKDLLNEIDKNKK